jgi:hypothetical protein
MSRIQVPRELSREQQQLLTNYITQYNQTNAHIDMLMGMLDEISANIVNILSASHANTTQSSTTQSSTTQSSTTQSNTTPSRRTMRRNANARANTSSASSSLPYSGPYLSSSSSPSYLYPVDNRHNYYNYNYNLSDPVRYTALDDGVGVTDLFTHFLNTPVAVRPTPEQIESASRLVKYEDIENPCSEVCPISLEPFTSNSEVRQLLHCGHIFHPTQFQTWFSSHVKCPVCRHDIRHNGEVTENANESSSASTSNTAVPTSTTRSLNNQSLNAFIDQVATNLFQSVLNPNNADGFMFDPSNNILFYETIIRPNRNNL